MTEGYPQLVVFVFLGVGLSLALIRPYYAFLLSIFLLLAGNSSVFDHTRTSVLGPYFNLGDACILVALTALFTDKLYKRQSIWFPQIIALMLFVLIIAAFQSFWKLGWTYETLRACRWAVQFPICYFLGANLVTSTKRAAQLVTVLFCGAAIAAVQHLFFAMNVWYTMSLDMETYYVMRTIVYLAGSLSSAFLLTAVVWKLPDTLSKKILYLLAGVLFLGTLFLSQTRSLWLATIGSVPCVLVLFRRRHFFVHIVRIGLTAFFVIAVFVLVMQRSMPGLNPWGVVTDRMERLVSDNPQFKAHTATREKAFKVELAQWLDGTLIFGRGLEFFQTMEKPTKASARAAFGHLGYITYLSQMGIIGLLVYSFYLVRIILRNARYLWCCSDVSILRYTALLGAASIISLSLMFLMSAHFLGFGSEGPGVLYGALWALVRNERRKINEMSIMERAI